MFSDYLTNFLNSMGREEGTICLVTGAILSASTLIAAIAWFVRQSRNFWYPERPPTSISRSCVTDVQAVSMFIIAAIMGVGLYVLDFHFLFDIIPMAMLLLALLFVFFRQDLPTAVTKFPWAFFMLMILAVGVSLVKVGRIASGKGYDDRIAAQVTGWQSLDEDTSLIALSYETESGLSCELYLEMNCLNYPPDNCDGSDNYQCTRETVFQLDSIQSRFIYSDNRDQIFSCRQGLNAQNDRNRQLEEEEEEEEEEGSEYPEIDTLAINSHVCKATWLTQRVKRRYFPYRQSRPDLGVWNCAWVAAATGLVALVMELLLVVHRHSMDMDDKTVEMLSQDTTTEISRGTLVC